MYVYTEFNNAVTVSLSIHMHYHVSIVTILVIIDSFIITVFFRLFFKSLVGLEKRLAISWSCAGELPRLLVVNYYPLALQTV